MRALIFYGLAAGIAVVAACDSAELVTPANVVSPSGTSSGGTSGSTDDDDDDAGKKPNGDDDDDDGGSAKPPPDNGEWGDPTDVRRPGFLRLEQLNVRRLFDTVCDSGTCTGSAAYEDQATQAQFDKRIKQIATDLATIKADVITLAEVENQACLDAVQKALKDAGFEYPVAYVAETGLPGSVDVAVLARGKMDSVVKYKQSTPLLRPDGSKTSFTRELPEVHLTLGSKKVVVFAAHFKAKTDDSDDPGRRLAEAKATHDIMDKTGSDNAKSLVVLGGDLNDVPGSDPINALEGDGKLLRVASDVTNQGTYKFGGADQPIDHIFVTKNHAKSYIAQSATVVRDGSAKGFAGSDHATLWADFSLP